MRPSSRRSFRRVPICCRRSGASIALRLTSPPPRSTPWPVLPPRPRPPRRPPRLHLLHTRAPPTTTAANAAASDAKAAPAATVSTAAMALLPATAGLAALPPPSSTTPACPSAPKRPGSQGSTPGPGPSRPCPCCHARPAPACSAPAHRLRGSSRPPAPTPRLRPPPPPGTCPHSRPSSCRCRSPTPAAGIGSSTRGPPLTWLLILDLISGTVLLRCNSSGDLYPLRPDADVQHRVPVRVRAGRSTRRWAAAASDLPASAPSPPTRSFLATAVATPAARRLPSANTTSSRARRSRPNASATGRSVDGDSLQCRTHPNRLAAHSPARGVQPPEHDGLCCILHRSTREALGL